MSSFTCDVCGWTCEGCDHANDETHPCERCDGVITAPKNQNVERLIATAPGSFYYLVQSEADQEINRRLNRLHTHIDECHTMLREQAREIERLKSRHNHTPCVQSQVSAMHLRAQLAEAQRDKANQFIRRMTNIHVHHGTVGDEISREDVLRSWADQAREQRERAEKAEALLSEIATNVRTNTQLAGGQWWFSAPMELLEQIDAYRTSTSHRT